MSGNQSSDVAALDEKAPSAVVDAAAIDALTPQEQPSASLGGSSTGWPDSQPAAAQSDVNSYDAGIRRLILLQTLAAQQAALLQAQSRALAASASSVTGPAQSAPPLTSAGTSLSELHIPQLFSIDSLPSPSHSVPPPPAPSLATTPWLPTISPVDSPWPSPPVASTSQLRGGMTADNWSALYPKDNQVDLWGSTSLASPSLPIVSPTASSSTHTWPPLQSPVPPIPPNPGPSAPGAGYPQYSAAFAAAPLTFKWPNTPAESVSKVEHLDQTPSPTSLSRASSIVRNGSVSKGKPVDDEAGSGDEDDKRRRNTEASARFRAKKKERDQQLRQTSIQLRERVTSLEKEASSLKAENQWLRELVSEKSDPR